jgi:hypothetical protein
MKPFVVPISKCRSCLADNEPALCNDRGQELSKESSNQGLFEAVAILWLRVNTQALRALCKCLSESLR